MHREISHSDRAFQQESRLSLYLLTGLIGAIIAADVWPIVAGWLEAWGLSLPTWGNEISGYRIALVAAVLGGARVLYGSLDSLLQGRIGADLALALACIAAICSPVALPSWLGWMVAALGAGTVVGVAALPALCRWPIGGKLGRVAEVLGSYAGRPRLLAVAALLGVVVQLANVVLLWLIGEGLGLPVPLAYYGVVMPLVALLTLDNR